MMEKDDERGVGRGGRGGVRAPITYTTYTTKFENWDHTEAAPESGWPQVRGRWKTDAHPPRHGPTKRKGIGPPMGPSEPHTGLGPAVPLSPRAKGGPTVAPRTRAQDPLGPLPPTALGTQFWT